MLTKIALLTTVVAWLAGAAVLAAGPASQPAGNGTAKRDGSRLAADPAAGATTCPYGGPGMGLGARRGWCGGRGQGGPGMGTGFGPGGPRGLGPRDGTGPRRDGSCLGS